MINRSRAWWAAALAVAVWAVAGPSAQRAPGAPATPAAPPPPVLVFETEKGIIEIELFPADAPKSVEHIVALFKRGFYRGQRFHRVTESLAQVGDQQTRDMSRRGYWGTGGSGRPIGVAEISKTRKHERGTVALANSGQPAMADSQFYIMKVAMPSLDGKYAVIGRVVRGMAVVDKLVVPDMIKDTYLKGEGPK